MTYPPPPGPSPEGQHQPPYNPVHYPPSPPMQPTGPQPTEQTGALNLAPKKAGVSVVTMAILLVLALAGGAVGGYFFAGVSEEAGGSDGADGAGSEFNEPELVGQPFDEQDFDDDRTFRDLSFDRLPSEWEEREEPFNRNGRTISDPVWHVMETPDDWISSITTGGLNQFVVGYDRTQMERSVPGILQEFMSNEVVLLHNALHEEITYSYHEVSGRPAVLGETVIAWDGDPAQGLPEMQVAVLIVDAGKGYAKVGVVAIFNEHRHEYDAAVEYLFTMRLF
ncbi:hypothetical protein [Natronoglycomyces albus]|uniref:Uncharacterized protein n=1 Tax=Natronoglycomyces albus TaxID=2811108 RepID=A0A895XU58_9ACTN|nr:hypothetical protein [Natronoglycomyces albus]QSB05188.1 hypothetical protein JQS30_15750 [Natronoglycomyces albus]